MNNTKTKTKSYLFAAIGFLLTLALDQWTKYLASTILRRLESFSLISGVFELRYLENRGAAFGIMQNRQIVFVVGGTCCYFVSVPEDAIYTTLQTTAYLCCTACIRSCGKYDRSCET